MHLHVARDARLYWMSVLFENDPSVQAGTQNVNQVTRILTMISIVT